MEQRYFNCVSTSTKYLAMLKIFKTNPNAILPTFGTTQSACHEGMLDICKLLTSLDNKFFTMYIFNLVTG